MAHLVGVPRGHVLDGARQDVTVMRQTSRKGRSVVESIDREVCILSERFPEGSSGEEGWIGPERESGLLR